MLRRLMGHPLEPEWWYSTKSVFTVSVVPAPLSLASPSVLNTGAGVGVPTRRSASALAFGGRLPRPRREYRQAAVCDIQRTRDDDN